MSKELDLVRLLINGANEYEKETGNKNPTVYLSRNNLLVIEKALLKAQKDRKALKIIKEKNVACDLLTNPDVMDYKKYNSHCDKYDFIVPLTEEEFNLLKEVLE